MPVTQAHNPQAQATARLGSGHAARVLEPSPPAVNEEPWFADDPTAKGIRSSERIVSPAGNGDIDWAEVTANNTSLAAFAQDGWLANFKRLGAPPANFANTRDALRDLAFNVLAPARQASSAKIALRWTRGGF